MKVYTITVGEHVFELAGGLVGAGQISNPHLDHDSRALAERITSGEYTQDEWRLFLRSSRSLIDSNLGEVPPLLEAAVCMLERVYEHLVNGGNPRDLANILRLGRLTQGIHIRQRDIMIALAVARISRPEGVTATEAISTVAQKCNMGEKKVEKAYYAYKGEALVVYGAEDTRPIEELLDLIKTLPP